MAKIIKQESHDNFDLMLGSFADDIQNLFDAEEGPNLSISEFIEREVDLGENVNLTLQQMVLLKTAYGDVLLEQEQAVLEYWQQADKTTLDETKALNPQIIIWEAGRRCLTKDSMILTNKGILNLGELDNEGLTNGHATDIDIRLAQLGCQKTSRSVELFKLGESPTVQLKTKLGFSIEGTSEHKVLLEKGDLNWVKLEKIKVGNKICLNKNTNLWSGKNKDLNYLYRVRNKIERFPTELTDEWAFALGYLNNRAYWYGNKLHVKDDSIETVVGKVPAFLIKPVYYSQDVGGVILNSAKLGYLNYLGLPCNQSLRDRETPLAIRAGTRDKVITYLKGLFFKCDTDVINFESEKLAKETQILLLNLGVVVKFNKNSIKNYTGYTKNVYSLETEGDVFSQLLENLGEAVSDESFFTDEVVEINTGYGVCYDLDVPGSSHYVANGIITHNSGKSSLVAIITAYEFYKLCRLKHPQAYYGVASSTPISILVLATTAQQAKTTIFRTIIGVFRSSKYFRKLEKEKKLFIGKEEISYDEKQLYIQSGHSNSGAQVGGTLKCLIMDEVTRFKSEEGGNNALALWSNLGISCAPFKHQAKRIAISSAWYEGDAIQKLYESTKSDSNAIAFRLKSWEVNPIHASRDNPIVASEYNIDPIKAATEFEGIRPSSVDAFLDLKQINKAFHGRCKVFASVLKNSGLVKLDITKIIKNEDRHNYVVHIDPAITKDSYAFALAHSEFDEEGRSIVHVDSLLAWEPDFQHDVSISNVGEVIKFINKSMPIFKVTADHYNSAETIQRLKEDGINAEIVFFSNRQQMLMYDLLRQLLHEERIVLPKDCMWAGKAIRELSQVQLLRGIKIDHPKGEGYSKDLADTIAAVAYMLNQKTHIHQASAVKHTNNPDFYNDPTANNLSMVKNSVRARRQTNLDLIKDSRAYPNFTEWS